MKSKFAHNRQLISELYGTNFSRNKLLSEAFTDTFTDDQEKIIKRIVSLFITYYLSNKSEANNSKSLIKTRIGQSIIPQLYPLKLTIDDMEKVLDLAIEIERNREYLVDVDKITSPEGNEGFSLLMRELLPKFEELKQSSSDDRKKSGGKETVAVTDNKPSKQEKQPAAKKDYSKISNKLAIKKIQVYIGVNPDGIWGSKTDTAWAAWVDSVSDDLITGGLDQNQIQKGKKNAALLASEYFNDKSKRNIKGVLELCETLGDAKLKEIADALEAAEGIKNPSWANRRQNKEIKDDDRRSGDVNPGELLEKGKLSINNVFTVAEYEASEGHHPNDNYNYPDDPGGLARLKGAGTERLQVSAKDSARNVLNLQSLSTGNNCVLVYDEGKKELYYDMIGRDGHVSNVVLQGNFLKAQTTNESNLAESYYGESRGSLYRKRYYGRY